MSDKEIIVTCKKHGVKYNVFDTHCSECFRDRSALDYVKKWLICQLCGEIKSSTQIYCGGPIGLMCDDCHKIVVKWEESKKKQEIYWEERHLEINTQVFFRATFDNDPIEAIWG